jgi:hypothetical protein
MKNRGDRTLWIGVGLAFALLLASWVALFMIAADNPVASVPLATTPDRTPRP